VRARRGRGGGGGIQPPVRLSWAWLSGLAGITWLFCFFVWASKHAPIMLRWPPHSRPRCVNPPLGAAVWACDDPLARAVPEAIKLLTRIMFAPDAPTDGFLNSTTVKLFTTAYNLTQSSRALGWDTNDYVMNTYRGCGNFSALTYTHTGYTGACACVCVRACVTLPQSP
jgi:hypothetical protein